MITVKDIDSVVMLAAYRPDLYDELVRQGREKGERMFKAQLAAAMQAGVENPLDYVLAQQG